MLAGSTVLYCLRRLQYLYDAIQEMVQVGMIQGNDAMQALLRLMTKLYAPQLLAGSTWPESIKRDFTGLASAQQHTHKISTHSTACTILRMHLPAALEKRPNKSLPRGCCIVHLFVLTARSNGCAVACQICIAPLHACDCCRPAAQVPCQTDRGDVWPEKKDRPVPGTEQHHKRSSCRQGEWGCQAADTVV